MEKTFRKDVILDVENKYEHPEMRQDTAGMERNSKTHTYTHTQGKHKALM